MSVVWTPLESNPDVMKTYAESLGLDTNLLQFHDVLSTDDWALDMIPRRVHSVIMVFPIKEASEKRKAEQNQRILKNGQTVSKNLYYMKQTVPNACGTIAILHAIGNLEKDLFNQVVKEGSYLDKFFKDTKTNEMAPTAIATYLENDEAIDALHSEASHQGQSEVPPEEEVVTNHFIAFRYVNVLI